MGLIFNTYFSIFISNNFLLEIYSIGFIVPGMIANWMSRQGVLRTITIILIITKLLLREWNKKEGMLPFGVVFMKLLVYNLIPTGPMKV